MTNGHAAWAHLVGAGNALQDIAADTTLPSRIRDRLAAIEAKSGSSNVLTRRDMQLIGTALIMLGERQPGQFGVA